MSFVSLLSSKISAWKEIKSLINKNITSINHRWGVVDPERLPIYESFKWTGDPSLSEGGLVSV